MITITISDIELYDNSAEEFITTEGGTFRFEHSLEAIANWEAIWKVPFFSAYEKLSMAQLKSYYVCMCVDGAFTEEHVIPEVSDKLTDYMNDTMTATTFSQNGNNSPSRTVLTSEIIYSYMVAAQVPFECARWNINRLLVLLRVISNNQQEPKKMTREETIKQNIDLNAERKRKLNTKG